MRRIALTLLMTLGTLCLAAGKVQAHEYHHGHDHWYGGPRQEVVVVRPPLWIAPPVIAPVRVYPPVYRYGYYCPAPSAGFYYQGRGLSIGVGF